MAFGLPDNPNYKIIITSNSRWGTVTGYIPENIVLSASSQFSQPFGQQLAESTLGKAVTTVTGVSPTSQSMTGQIWQGSTPMELSLDLDFLAERDPKTEVQDKIKTLMKMAMPSKGAGGFLMKTPGPSYGETTIRDWTSSKATAEGAISIAVGKFLYFDSVLINNVQANFHSVIHESGLPLHATCTIQFSTFFVMLAEDLDLMFVQ